MKLVPLKKHRMAAGFSLPEVTMAVAIAGLGLTTLLGFMPQSLDTLRRAGEVTAETRISQQIFSTLASAEWGNATQNGQSSGGQDGISAAYNGRRYFDDLAIELNARDSGEMLSYVAEVDVPNRDIVLPSGTAAGSSAQAHEENLRRVTVRVANTSQRDFDFDNAPVGTYRTYASLVSRAGK